MTKLAQETEPGQAYIQAVGPGAYQAVSTSGTSAATTNGVASDCTVVFLYCDEDVHIAFGAAPTATTSDFFLPASTSIAFRITPGHKVAGIQSSAAGTLRVSEGSA